MKDEVDQASDQQPASKTPASGIINALAAGGLSAFLYFVGMPIFATFMAIVSVVLLFMAFSGESAES